ncbi:hypothetical protein ACFX13_014731 [Malus domestica]|uniref:Uncharacterized protein n=1 Tax=Malus domestica TaxID=3750 RepID=A0A498I132_MALDO|nr:hypothetical protein DVH24_019698 [Malus domestica]
MSCKRRKLQWRLGVEEFIDDAYKKRVPVVVLTTYSKSGNQIARSIVEKLGEERVSKLKMHLIKELKPMLNEVVDSKSYEGLESSSHISATQPFFQSLKSGSAKSVKVVTRAMSKAAENTPLPGLPIDLRGNRVFVAGVVDSHIQLLLLK